MSDTLVIIPARYASQRFSGKPLCKIQDKTMIEWVYRGAEACGFPLCVVTDDERIEAEVKGFGGQVVRVDDDVPSGSERIYLAYKRNFAASGTFKRIINLQGDEPLIKGQLLKKLSQAHGDSGYDVMTLVKERDDREGFEDPNIVKAIFLPENAQCLYFSRASIPFSLDAKPRWFQHIGIYSYTPEALEKFCQHESSALEKREKLEQLRNYSHGLTIGAMKTDHTFIGVDKPEDIRDVEEILSES